MTSCLGSSNVTRYSALWSSVPANFLSKIIRENVFFLHMHDQPSVQSARWYEQSQLWERLNPHTKILLHKSVIQQGEVRLWMITTFSSYALYSLSTLLKQLQGSFRMSISSFGIDYSTHIISLIYHDLAKQQVLETENCLWVIKGMERLEYWFEEIAINSFVVICMENPTLQINGILLSRRYIYSIGSWPCFPNVNANCILLSNKSLSTIRSYSYNILTSLTKHKRRQEILSTPYFPSEELSTLPQLAAQSGMWSFSNHVPDILATKSIISLRILAVVALGIKEKKGLNWVTRLRRTSALFPCLRRSERFMIASSFIPRASKEVVWLSSMR